MRCGVRHLVPLFWLAGTSPAAATLIDRTINIQPIDVCNTDGTGCANGGGLIASSLSATETIWAQAGLNVTFLPAENYDNSAYTATSVSVANAATDQGRQLMRLPGHDQSSDPQTLNMYFVSNLLDSTGAQTLYGFSFVGGNGMIIGPDPRLDTIAHEIGHNLGLDHTTFGAGPSVPTNLMTDGNYRTIPTSVSQIASGATDNLTTAQITQARSPLFSVGNLVETMSTDQFASVFASNPSPNGPLTILNLTSPQAYPDGVNFAPPNGSANLPPETLTDVKVRFLPDSSVTPFDTFNAGIYQIGTGIGTPEAGLYFEKDFVLDPGFGFDQSTGASWSNQPFYAYGVEPSISTLPDGTVQWDVSLTDASAELAAIVGSCPPPEGTPCTSTLVPFSALPSFTAYDFLILRLFNPLGGAGPIPFSVLFTYADGFTSQAFYDATTGTISTGAADTINAWLPGTYPVADPNIVVPTTDVVAIDPTVPEPSSALMLATAVVAVVGLRNRLARKGGPTSVSRAS